MRGGDIQAAMPARRPLPLFAAVALTLLIAACGPAPTDPGPGGVTVEEAQALDEAAEKLEAEQANPPLLPDGAEKD
jgi:hypothetical protein